jgi:hypothetical protein
LDGPGVVAAGWTLVLAATVDVGSTVVGNTVVTGATVVVTFVVAIVLGEVPPIGIVLLAATVVLLTCVPTSPDCVLLFSILPLAALFTGANIDNTRTDSTAVIRNILTYLPILSFPMSSPILY